jgi:hypothetical protein
MTPENRKRLALDIPRELHHELKVAAIEHNTSITILVCQWLVSKLNEQKKLSGEGNDVKG